MMPAADPRDDVHLRDALSLRERRRATRSMRSPTRGCAMNCVATHTASRCVAASISITAAAAPVPPYSAPSWRARSGVSTKCAAARSGADHERDQREVGRVRVGVGPSGQRWVVDVALSADRACERSKVTFGPPGRSRLSAELQAGSSESSTIGVDATARRAFAQHLADPFVRHPGRGADLAQAVARPRPPRRCCRATRAAPARAVVARARTRASAAGRSSWPSTSADCISRSVKRRNASSDGGGSSSAANTIRPNVEQREQAGELVGAQRRVDHTERDALVVRDLAWPRGRSRGRGAGCARRADRDARPRSRRAAGSIPRSGGVARPWLMIRDASLHGRCDHDRRSNRRRPRPGSGRPSRAAGRACRRSARTARPS